MFIIFTHSCHSETDSNKQYCKNFVEEIFWSKTKLKGNTCHFIHITISIEFQRITYLIALLKPSVPGKGANVYLYMRQYKEWLENVFFVSEYMTRNKKERFKKRKQMGFFAQVQILFF